MACVSNKRKNLQSRVLYPAMLSFRIKEELFRLAKTETVHQYYTDPKSYRNLWIRKTPMSARRRIVKAVGSTT